MQNGGFYILHYRSIDSLLQSNSAGKPKLIRPILEKYMFSLKTTKNVAELGRTVLQDLILILLCYSIFVRWGQWFYISNQKQHIYAHISIYKSKNNLQSFFELDKRNLFICIYGYVSW